MLPGPGLRRRVLWPSFYILPARLKIQGIILTADDRRIETLPTHPVVLQVEREDGLMYVSLEME